MALDHIHVQGKRGDLMDDAAIGLGRVHVANINLRTELLKYVNARSISLWKQLWLLAWGAKKRRADDIDAIT
eukprot:5634853-Amphidinium_carterae.1